MESTKCSNVKLIFAGIWLLLFSTLSCQKEEAAAPETLFREVPPEVSGVDFANELSPDDSFNIIEYLYYYNGGGVAVGDINNDSLPDLYFTANQAPNALFLNRGNLQFEEVTQAAGVGGMDSWSTGVTMADVNADGWLDIYVCYIGDYKKYRGHNQLFINQQDGTFREAAAEYGLDFSGFATQAAFFDYDGDGDLDCYLLNHSVHSSANYSPSDIRETRDSLAGDRLLRNDGGRFIDVTAAANIYSSPVGYGLGIATGDINNDGCPDIYVSNDFHENDYLYYNNCDGTFREALSSSIGHTSTFSMGNDMADFNNDGRLDLLSLDMKPADEAVLKKSVGADPYNIYAYKLKFGYYFQYPRNMLQWNRGNLNGKEAAFSEIGHLAGVEATDWSWAPFFVDLDADGWKDLFISTGIWQRPNDLDYLKYISNRQIQSNASDLELAEKMPPGQVRNFAFRNTGALNFEEVTDAWGLDLAGASTGAAYADLDRDGDLDLVLNNLNRGASVFENRRSGKEPFHFLQLTLRGDPGNPFGIGARVEVQSHGQRQVQELYTTRGFQSAVAPELNFGLGAANQIDRLTIRWPDGNVQELKNVPANQRLRVQKSGNAGKPVAQRSERPTDLFQPVPAAAGVDFEHSENEYTDFDAELLLPHKLSTEGPAIATGDVDGDGWEDVYICGARGQSGRLYRQMAGGRFERLSLTTEKSLEEVDAVFFDADGDGDADLYIVGGGGEVHAQKNAFRDQLWFNNGAGDFQPAFDALPQIKENGSCVVPLDFDGDGAMDLFVGSRSVPGKYGLSPKSYLLKNEGKGRFSDVSAQLLPEQGKLGMVTDAVLLRGLDRQQLALVGEWMPVTLLTPGTTKWAKAELPYSNGWWNTVYPADLDADGDEDLVLGNLGWNADLRASREEPVELFVGDFDQNNKTDPILTYYKNGKRYTYASLDDLAMQLNILRKLFPDYAVFAEKTFEEVFPAETIEGAIHRYAYTFASSVAINLGNGAFELQPLPRQAQIAPLFSFTAADYDQDGVPDLVAVGNFYDTSPQLGRYDASYGHFLKGLGDGHFEAVDPLESGFVVKGQGRDIASVAVSEEEALLLIARNGAPVVGYRVRVTPGAENEPPRADHRSGSK